MKNYKHPLSLWLIVICCGNGNNFYSTDRLIDCLEHQFDIDCYGSLALT